MPSQYHARVWARLLLLWRQQGLLCISALRERRDVGVDPLLKLSIQLWPVAQQKEQLEPHEQRRQRQALRQTQPHTAQYSTLKHPKTLGTLNRT